MDVTPAIPEYEIIAPNEAIVSWKNEEITRQVLEIVEQEIYNSGFRVGAGETLGANIVQDTARAVGYIEGLTFLRDLLELHRVVGGKEDDDSEGKENS